MAQDMRASAGSEDVLIDSGVVIALLGLVVAACLLGVANHLLPGFGLVATCAAIAVGFSSLLKRNS